MSDDRETGTFPPMEEPPNCATPPEPRPLTVEELKAAKRELEQNILNLLVSFGRYTGVVVTDINLKVAESADGRQLNFMVRCEARL
jgi:hypothetical protein